MRGKKNKSVYLMTKNKERERENREHSSELGTCNSSVILTNDS